MRQRIVLLVALAALVVSALPAVATEGSAGGGQNPDGAQVQASDGTSADGIDRQALAEELAAEDEDGTYIVQFHSPAPPAYIGGIEGLEATASEEDFDPNSAAVDAYREHLTAEQDEGLEAIETELEREVSTLYQYSLAINGAALELSPDEAAQVALIEEVAYIEREKTYELMSDAGPQHIGAETIWEGEFDGADGEHQGEDVVVGILDTGISPENPSFAEVGPVDEYEHNWDGEYLGACDEDSDHYEEDFPCNDKLIGAYGFPPGQDLARDGGDHGSHTSSTAAGNVVDIELGPEGNEEQVTISGVAPHAHIISYAVCTPGCSDANILGGIEQATEDEVDVINYSIGAAVPSENMWNEAASVAWLNANAAGVRIAQSAGNAGPGDATVGRSSDLPWVTSVGASEHNRAIENELTDISVNGESASDDIIGKGFTGDLDAGTPVVYDTDDPYCYDPDSELVEGNIVLCDRGGPDPIGRVEGSENVDEAGGAGFVLMNTEEQADSVHGDEFAVPGLHVSWEHGESLKSLVTDNDDEVTAGVAGYEFVLDHYYTDYHASFSSRGPSGAASTLVPNVTAPGLDIIAAYGAYVDGEEPPVEWGVMSGTSMSSPHVAGAYALLADARPDWSPAATQSAVQLTARPDTPKEDGSQGDPHSEGSGYTELGGAVDAGFVMDITSDEFWDADPDEGGDVRQLNFAELVDLEHGRPITFNRSLTSTQDAAVTYTVDFEGDEGLQLDAPGEVAIDAGESAAVEFTASADADFPIGTMLYGRVTLTPDDDNVPEAHMPVVVQTSEPESVMTLDPEELDETVEETRVETGTLTIGNAGEEGFDWNLADTGDGAIWSQPIDGTSGIVSDRFLDGEDDAGVFSADDFSVGGDGATAESIFTPGFWAPTFPEGTVTDAEQISWYIYPDEDGAPAGHPDDGQEAEVWSFEAAADADGVTIDDEDVTLDLAAAGAPDLELDAGDYWISVFPDIERNTEADDGLNDRWNWYNGTSSGESAKVADPDGLFGDPSEEWQDFAELGLDWDGLAFTLSGQFGCDMPDDISWLDLDPQSGSVDPDGEQTVDVTYDATDLDLGTYTATLCLENDFEELTQSLPVTLEVTEFVPVPEISVDPEEIDAEVPAGGSNDETLTIANVGDEDLEWDIADAEPADPANHVTGDATVLPSTAAPGSTTIGDTELRTQDLEGEPQRFPHEFEPAQEQVTITHSESQDIVEVNSAACGGLEGTSENSYLRTFTLEDFDLDGGFDVAEVEFGVEQHVGPAVTGDVNLYLLEGEELLYENLTEIGSAEVDLDDSQVGEILTVPVEGTAPAGATLVVEVVVPPVDALFGGFYIGSNPDGQTAPTYIASDDCDMPEPTDAAEIDFADMHMVMNVTGDALYATCSDPTSVPWLSVDPASGTTGPGESDDVTVTMDGSDLSPGDELEAVLCVSSNAANDGLLELPVSATVTDEDDDPPPQDPVDLVVSPDESTVGVDGVVQLEATAIYEDDETADVTVEAEWASEDTDVATVDDAGLVAGVAEGLTEVTATFEDVSDSALITVDAEVEPGPEGLERISAEPGRVEVAIAASEHRFDDGEADAVVLARADEYPDALAGTTLAAEHDAPLLLTSSDQLLGNVADEIARVLGDEGAVYLTGGTAALDENVEDAVGDLGYDLTRLGGETRFETAGLIADELGERSQVLVTTGLDFPDALTAGAAASANDGVVLLSADEDPHEVVDDYLDGFDGAVTAVGGPATRAYPDAEAVMGETRDETAVAVAEAFFDEPAAFGVARRDDYPDALAGGAHIAAYEGPLLLSYTEDVPEETAEWLQATEATGGFVYGGTAAIDEDTFDELEDLAGFGNNDNDDEE